MSRFAVITFAVLLTGCALFRTAPRPIVQPEGPTTPSVVVTLGDSLDQSDGKVAAAITVARDNADKPEVVKAEAGVALSYLPAPSPGDLAIAQARAAKADPKTYQLAEDDGRKLLAAVNVQWAKLEKQQADAKKASDDKDALIKDLRQQLVEKESDLDKVPIRVAAGIAFLAAIALAVTGRYHSAGACVVIGGVLITTARLLSNPTFITSVIVSTTAILASSVWWYWDKVRDAVNASRVVKGPHKLVTPPKPPTT